MKYIKKFNESIEKEENINNDNSFILAKIKDKYSKDEVSDWLSKEIKQWLPEDKDGYWYEKYGDGVAEDVILSSIIGWYEKEYSKIENNNNYQIIYNILEEYYFKK